MIVDVQLVAVIKDTNQAIFSYCYGYLLFKISKIVNVIAYCDCIAINYWSKSDLSDIGTKQKKIEFETKTRWSGKLRVRRWVRWLRFKNNIDYFMSQWVQARSFVCSWSNYQK